MSLIDSIKAARRVSVPLLGVSSADQIATEAAIRSAVNGGSPLIRWDCVVGAAGLNEIGVEALLTICEGNSPGDLTVDCVGFLSLCGKLPSGSIILLHNAHRVLDAAGVVQALQNLRDMFKADKRTVVLLAPEIKLPAELRGDVVCFDESLPDRETIGGIVRSLIEGAGLPVDESAINQASEALVGLSAFPVEQSAAMSITKEGIDIEACWGYKRKLVAQTPGLSMDASVIKYADVGGNQGVKDFFAPIFKGSDSPDVIVQFEELEKFLAGSSGDTSGVSQDQLGVLLDAIESNNWIGALFLGPAGGGKSYFSAALSGEFEKRRILCDLGGMKGQYVGTSEGAIRSAVKTILAIGGKKVLVCATCNDVRVLPAAILRRFNSCGMWFFDLGSSEEKKAIWKIQAARFGYAAENLPDDSGWSAANIRDCCRSAKLSGISLQAASQYVISALSQDGENIERLRRMAHGRFLSASEGRAYRMPSGVAVASSSRSLEV